MEWLPLFILFFSYFAERLFGTRLKERLFRSESPLPSPPTQVGFSFVYLCGIFLTVTGIYLHNHYFYSCPLDPFAVFVGFIVIFLFFLNTGFYREFSQSIFQKSLKGEPKEEIIKENNRLRRYVASPLSVKAESGHPHVLIVTVAFLLETVVAPIFLFLVGGYLLFGIYFTLYLLLVPLRLQNRFLLALYRGSLFLPALFSLVVFTFSAFAAGKSFGKVSLAILLDIRKCLAGFDQLFLLNVTAMLAVLEVTLTFRYGGKEYTIAQGEEMLTQRTFVLTQRLLGIQKFMTYVFSYYLYILL